MLSHRVVGIALVVSSVLIAAAWRGSAAEEKPEPNTRAANAKARVEAAKGVFQSSQERQRHETIPPHQRDADYFYRWSVRWLQAERDLSQSPAEQVAALEAHLKRMQAMDKETRDQRRRGQAATTDVFATEFFRLEAEDWLATAKASGK